MEETNADWWTGKVNGRRGLFPSNYVEKMSSSEKTNQTAMTHSVPPDQGEKKAYKPFMAARHGIDTPPPAGQGANSLGLQQASGQEAKASKYGAYKNTVRGVFSSPFPSTLLIEALGMDIRWLIRRLLVLVLVPAWQSAAGWFGLSSRV